MPRRQADAALPGHDDPITRHNVRSESFFSAFNGVYMALAIFAAPIVAVTGVGASPLELTILVSAFPVGAFLGPLWALLDTHFESAAADRTVRADDARTQEVLRLRKENFETTHGDPRQLVPGRSWAAWARALGHLLPPLDVKG